MPDDISKNRRRVDVSFSEKDITQDGVTNKVPVIAEFRIKNLSSMNDGDMDKEALEKKSAFTRDENFSVNNSFSAEKTYTLGIGKDGTLVYKHPTGKDTAVELTVKEAFKIFKEQSEGVLVTEDGKYSRGATDNKIVQALENTPRYVNGTNKALGAFTNKDREPSDPDLKQEVMKLLGKNLLPNNKESNVATTVER